VLSSRPDKDAATAEEASEALNFRLRFAAGPAAFSEVVGNALAARCLADALPFEATSVFLTALGFRWTFRSAV
jgi:hypothetical protein